VADPYGLRRVVRPQGVLPQQAEVLDPRLPLGPDELFIDVEHLNIDAASFRQLASTGRPIDAQVMEIVGARGKMQNPVTGSGGMLIGRVASVGAEHPAAGELKSGNRVATLVSLTLTPLLLDEVRAVRGERIEVRGRAADIQNGERHRVRHVVGHGRPQAAGEEHGAPAWVARLATAGQRVLIIGAGKSGSLACAQAKRNGARVTVADVRESTFVADGLADEALLFDARKPLDAPRGSFDLVINCASVPGTEMASILAARDGGEVLFFSMATSFTAAALGAEGVGKDVRLTIGNGYARGHARLALQLVRDTPALRKIFAAHAG
jgi:L-erythro-3,5-diaminohexanoate dehydrogenase